MNKALHVLVYVFLALAAAALWFERELSAKRAELTDRNKLQEEYIAKISKSVEQKQRSDKQTNVEIMKDTDSTENPLDRAPNENNILDDYNASLEHGSDKFVNISDSSKLRDRDSLENLVESAKDQQKRLENTRAALSKLREKLEAEVSELNALKKSAREDKATIEKKKQEIEELETAKKELEDDNKRIKNDVDNLKSRITPLNDEVNTAKEETEAAKEEVAKLQEKNAQLVKRLQESIQTTPRTGDSVGGATSVDKLPFGDKGKIIRVVNEKMFVVVEFSDKTMDELKGSDRKGPMPAIEFLVKRNGPDGKPMIVGRIRIVQETSGTNYVTCDILGEWEQGPLMVGDIVFAD
jgi:myosin heavy subunit